MINESVIFFGYGDIEVLSVPGMLIFHELSEPISIGIHNKDLVLLKRNTLKPPIFINLITFDECNKLDILLQKVERNEIDKFDFNGYTFDFSKFNRKSVYVCRKNLERLINSHCQVLAC